MDVIGSKSVSGSPAVDNADSEADADDEAAAAAAAADDDDDDDGDGDGDDDGEKYISAAHTHCLGCSTLQKPVQHGLSENTNLSS